jgi:alanyl-tRNA synthetase
MKKDIEQFQAQRVQALAQELVAKGRIVNGVKVVTAQAPIAPDAAKDLVFKVRELCQENLVCVVGSVFNEKPMLNIMLSDDMVKNHGLNAGQMVREAAKLMQGGGGGQPHFASAGGKNTDGLSAAIDRVIELANL